MLRKELFLNDQRHFQDSRMWHDSCYSLCPDIPPKPQVVGCRGFLEVADYREL